MTWAGSFTCLSFKRELFEGVHDFRIDAFMLALYTEFAVLSDGITGYEVDGEVLPLGGYTTGGRAVVVYPPSVVEKTAVIQMDDVVWAGSTITARGAICYNASKPGLPALFVLDFGANRISNAGNFIVRFPVSDPNAAILRIT